VYLKDLASKVQTQRPMTLFSSHPEGRYMAAKKTVEDLLSDEIKDLYSAEKQLTKAIPKMAKGATDDALQSALQAHLIETEKQVARLEEAAVLLSIKPGGKKCAGMEGVIREGAEVLAETGDETVLDLGIIGAASRVEHYEIAGYLTAINLAKRMKAGEVAMLLEQSLAEEQEAERKLRAISVDLVKAAATITKAAA
jgi:ferritin-like metal-binding protein YciE